MVDTNDKSVWLKDLDAREVFPLNARFWLARLIANISVERYKQYILPAIRLIIP